MCISVFNFYVLQFMAKSASVYQETNLFEMIIGLDGQTQVADWF